MTLEFIDTRLNDKVAYGFKGGPRWNTRSTPMRNGYEYRNAEWVMPLHSYEAEYALLKETLQDDLLAAMWVARGKLRAFRFKDWNDWEVTQARGALAVPTTSTSPIQLRKSYAFGPETLTRNITLPLSVQLFADGTPYNDCTVDLLTGLATPSTTWPDADLSWAGEFDVRVHFADDYNQLARARPRVSTTIVRIEEVRR